MRNAKHKIEHRQRIKLNRGARIASIANFDIRAYMLNLFDTRHDRPDVRGRSRSGHSIPWVGSLVLVAACFLCGCTRPYIDGSEKAPSTKYEVIEGSAAHDTDTRLDDLLAAVGELKAASSYRPEPFDTTRVDSLEARVEALERQRSKAPEAPKYTQPREQVGTLEQECGPGGCPPARSAPVFQRLPIVRRLR